MGFSCRKVRIAFLGLSLVLLLTWTAVSSAETYPLRLRNVSGRSVDYATDVGPVFTGTSWVVLDDWESSGTLHVQPDRYLFYRYHGATTGWRHYFIGKVVDDFSEWRFIPGGAFFPGLQKVPVEFVNINGAWKMGGPYNVGMPCKVIQSRTMLTFINENGNKAKGYFKNKNTVIAVDWGNLIGVITADAKRINWKNNTWWIR